MLILRPRAPPNSAKIRRHVFLREVYCFFFVFFTLTITYNKFLFLKKSSFWCFVVVEMIHHSKEQTTMSKMILTIWAHNVAGENISAVFGIAERVARIFEWAEVRGSSRPCQPRTRGIVATALFPVLSFGPQLQATAIETKHRPHQAHADALLEKVRGKNVFQIAPCISNCDFFKSISNREMKIVDFSNPKCWQHRCRWHRWRKRRWSENWSLGIERQFPNLPCEKCRIRHLVRGPDVPCQQNCCTKECKCEERGWPLRRPKCGREVAGRRRVLLQA